MEFSISQIQCSLRLKINLVHIHNGAKSWKSRGNCWTVVEFHIIDISESEHDKHNIKSDQSLQQLLLTVVIILRVFVQWTKILLISENITTNLAIPMYDESSLSNVTFNLP